jgi:cytochrome c oxidase assembly protein subunit 11
VSGRRHARKFTVGALVAMMAVMFALVGASVPLYRLFCAATGYGGTTQRADAAPDQAVAARTITVRFDSQTAPDLPWDFRPVQASVQIHPGEEKVIYYRAVNRSKEPITGTATFNVTPYKVGLYFDKLQCFCFTKQYLAPGESKELSVSFFVDPAIVKDANASDVDTITLSYTMFRAKSDGAEPVQSSSLR